MEVNHRLYEGVRITGEVSYLYRRRIKSIAVKTWDSRGYGNSISIIWFLVMGTESYRKEKNESVQYCVFRETLGVSITYIIPNQDIIIIVQICATGKSRNWKILSAKIRVNASEYKLI